MKRKVLEFSISEKLPIAPVQAQTIINTLNPHSYCIAKKDPVFKESLLSSNILLADGIGIVLASLFLYGKRLKRITGSDVHNHFLLQAQNNNMKVFYLGASKSTIHAIKKNVLERYPNVNCEGYSPPYKEKFSRQDTNDMIKAVNDYAPDILFIGLTAPKQEKWSFENKLLLNAKSIVSIGAVFDFFSQNVKRAPNWVRVMGLEWFFRLIKEPKRLWRRYILNNFLFCYFALMYKFKSKND